MEEGKSSSQSTNGSSRWNPTKEQLSRLENLYKQGLRTPTYEQIQQITSKLREFGSIEGKNVFYWFQNHKARQRQKQKQQTFAYYTKLLKRSPQVLAPVAPMPQPNVVASNSVVLIRPTMYATPQVGCLNFYPQAQDQDQVQHSAMFNPESSIVSPAPVFPAHTLTSTKYAPINNVSVSDPVVGTEGRETLQLFPLHPANWRSERLGSALISVSASSSPMSSSDRTEGGGGEAVGEHQYFFDFLGALNG